MSEPQPSPVSPAFATLDGTENLLNRLVTGMEHLVGALDHGAQMVPGLAGLGPILMAARTQIQQARTLLTPPEVPVEPAPEAPTIESIHGEAAMSEPQPNPELPPGGGQPLGPPAEPPASPPSETPPEPAEPAPEPAPPPEAPPVDAPAEGPQPDHS